MSNSNPPQLTNETKAQVVINASFFWFDRMVTPFLEKTKDQDHSKFLFDIYRQLIKHFSTQLNRSLSRDWYNTYVLGCVDYIPQQSWMNGIEKTYLNKIPCKFPEGKYSLFFDENWTLYLLFPQRSLLLVDCIPNPVPFFECAYDIELYYHTNVLTK